MYWFLLATMLVIPAPKHYYFDELDEKWFYYPNQVLVDGIWTAEPDFPGIRLVNDEQ